MEVNCSYFFYPLLIGIIEHILHVVRHLHDISHIRSSGDGTGPADPALPGPIF